MGVVMGNNRKKTKYADVKQGEAKNLSTAMLFDILKSGQKPMRIDQILRISGAMRKQKRLVENMLFQLLEEGKILRMHGGQWVCAGKMRTFVGKYSIQRSGVGYVDLPKDNADQKQTKNNNKFSSIFVHPSQAGEAWHGDSVSVVILPGRGAKGSDSKKPEGRIIEVLERQAKQLTVRVLHQEKGQGSFAENFLLCKPVDARFPFLMRLDSSNLANMPKRGELLLVEPTNKLASDLWAATAIAAIGFEEDVAVQENIVKLNHEAPSDFPPAVLAEVSSFASAPQAEDLKGREDLSKVPFVTIDGETAKDFDDAIHVEVLENGWCLRVGIADVTHYVRPRSALDKEAQVRGNSWYFPRSVEPMLPHALSNGLCSLNPHEDRLIMLAELYIDKAGTVQKTRFANAYMHSAARLTYNQVKSLILDNDQAEQQKFVNNIGEKAPIILQMLAEAERLARVLAKVRLDRGCLDFHMPEPEYSFDERGRIIDISKKENHFAHQIIEEFMIAANEAVSRFLTKKDVPFLYRVHPEPESGHLEGLFRTLATTDMAEHIPKKPTAANLQDILHKAKGSPQEFLVSRLCLRTMPQARYYPENIGHFGLASTNYCHFTSPIRRYADVIVHRALKYALGLDSVEIPTEPRLVMIADKINRCERAAIEAEREMAKRLAVLLLQDRVGEGFEGVICGVSDFGIFVEFNDMPVEGMIRIRDLGDDYFEYDPERQELTGVMQGKVYGLGQVIRTRLIEVNLTRLEITLGLVKKSAGAKKRPQQYLKKRPKRK